MNKGIRINKYIAMCTELSRRKAEEYINLGKVKVNGKVMKDLSYKVNRFSDSVTLDDEKLKLITEFTYIMLNKPKGYITTTDDQFNKKNVMDLLPEFKDENLFPVGRLDFNTEGLIILTNDGNFSNRVIHPSSTLEKEYLAICKDEVPDEALALLREPIEIGKVMTKPAQIRIENQKDGKTYFEVTIHEGRNRQIRRLFERSNLNLIYLKRVRIGKLKLGNLARGKYRKLEDFEVNFFS